MTLASRINDFAAAARDKINQMVPRLMPAGGAAGQVLIKTSAADYDAGWQVPSASSQLTGTSSVSVPQASFTHVEAVPAIGVAPGMLVFLAIGAHADTDENSPELLEIAALSGLADTDEIIVTLNFAAATSGSINLNWSAI